MPKRGPIEHVKTSRHKLNDEITLVFKWAGGAYIDVYREFDSAPNEVINVWDYAKGESRIPFTQEALKRRTADWIAQYCDNFGRETLIHDVTTNWRRY